MFSETEATHILHISLATIPHDNVMVLSGELSGEFSVRSAYNILKSYKNTTSPNTADNTIIRF